MFFQFLVGGYLSAESEKSERTENVEQNSSSQTQAGQEQSSDTVEYRGETYKYNDHLSNYLFMGIDTRNPIDTYQTQEDAGQADAISGIYGSLKQKR